jgi:hypothetical protein
VFGAAPLLTHAPLLTLHMLFAQMQDMEIAVTKALEQSV